MGFGAFHPRQTHIPGTSPSTFFRAKRVRSRACVRCPPRATLSLLASFFPDAGQPTPSARDARRCSRGAVRARRSRCEERDEDGRRHRDRDGIRPAHVFRARSLETTSRSILRCGQRVLRSAQILAGASRRRCSAAGGCPRWSWPQPCGPRSKSRSPETHPTHRGSYTASSLACFYRLPSVPCSLRYVAAAAAIGSIIWLFLPIGPQPWIMAIARLVPSRWSFGLARRLNYEARCSERPSYRAKYCTRSTHSTDRS